MVISEGAFVADLRDGLAKLGNKHFDFVTGPGRSGAIASVYVSHMLHIPFLPYGQHPVGQWSVLIVDTARNTGKTLRKACKKYDTEDCLFVYDEPPRVRFWYEIMVNLKNLQRLDLSQGAFGRALL